jgi:hypothetical protein
MMPKVRLVLSMFAAIGLLVAISSPAGAGAPVPTKASSHHVPVYAYFYQWYERGSWDRAKKDFPLAGNYSSDDPHVLRNQVRQAKAAGIDGFLTSWKSTPTLNRRLTLLLNIAQAENLDVGVVYEALNFYRRPLPIRTVKADMLRLVAEWGNDLRSSFYGRPLIIWTGTDEYSLADIREVRSALGSRAYLLAASKSVAGYQRVAETVDGEAYYWSSANPRSTSTQRKLNDIGAAVHRHGGIWMAPAASGFDGTTLGHSRVIDRDGGATLSRSLANALRSKPDGIGVISWNEWSENTYIEPGQRYGGEELNVLRNFVREQDGGVVSSGERTPSATSRSTWSGLRAALLLALITALATVALCLRGSRGRRRHKASHARRDEPNDRNVDGCTAELAPDSNGRRHSVYLPTR